MRGDAGEQAKDGKLCLHCGGPRPSGLRVSPSKFCSAKCRNRARHSRVAEARPCCVCGQQFTVASKSSRQKCCSQSCGGKTPESARHRQQLHDARRVTYKCLNCGIDFNRKQYKSGAYSCQKKYCSRDCAFEARRRRVPAAIDNNRKGGVTARLAAWFLSWGDDVFPHLKKCDKCGEMLTVTHAGHDPQCRKYFRRKECRGCGADLTPDRPLYISFCEPCREKNRRESRRRHKKKHGRNHRQRCRKYGAPYTKIRELDIYERDNWTCQICGCELRRDWDANDQRSRTIDHIIPLSLGPLGPGHVPSNVRACCHGCNTRKSDSIEPGALQTLH